MRIRQVWIGSYALPLPQAWPSSEGAVDKRAGAILLLDEEGGRVGRGESAPWPGFGLETLPSSEAALRSAASRLVGIACDVYLEAAADLPRLAPVAASPCARHAIDLALHDLAAQHAKVPIARLLGGPEALLEVPVNATIPRLPPEEISQAAEAAVSMGVGTIKLKVGGAPLAEDVERVRALRRAVGPNICIRIDANQAWSEDEAVQALRALQPYDLEYCEQPVAADAVEALVRVRRASGVPIAADEAVRDFATARRILIAEAADVLIVKPMALGGLHAARAIAAQAEEFGAGVVVTSLLESAVGRTGALHLAASLGPTRFAHGVGAGWSLLTELQGEGGEPLGKVRVPTEPGLGVNIEYALRRAAELVASAEEEP